MRAPFLDSIAQEERITQQEKDEILKDNLDHTLFSWSKQKGINPISVERAEGIYLYDYDGKQYMDFSSGLVNVNIGHGNQRVTEAVTRQMMQVAYVAPNCITKVRGQLGKKLAEISPGDLNRTFFTLCGATSIENAIKMARIYTGKYKVLGRYRAYHGSTYGAMSASGDPRKLDSQQAPNFIQVEDPYCYRCPWGQEPGSCSKLCISHLERIVQFEGPETIAAIIMEGESGSSGCIKYPEGYLAAVRRICDQHGILLIVDEVQSGMGRTGKMFACEHYDVQADIVCIAKGIASGLPIGVCVARADLMDWKPGAHASTFGGNPVAVASALTTIELLEQELVENAAKVGAHMMDRMKQWPAKFPCVGDVRGLGLIGTLFSS